MKTKVKLLSVIIITLFSILLLGTTKVNGATYSDSNKSFIITTEDLGINGTKTEVGVDYWREEPYFDNYQASYSNYVRIIGVNQTKLNEYAKTPRTIKTHIKSKLPTNDITKVVWLERNYDNGKYTDTEKEEIAIETIDGNKYISYDYDLRYNNYSEYEPVDSNIKEIFLHSDKWYSTYIKVFKADGSNEIYSVETYIDIFSDNQPFEYQIDYVNKYGESYPTIGGMGGGDDTDKFYLTSKWEVDGGFGFFERYVLPTNVNLSEAYFQLYIDSYQGEKLKIENFGTLYYAGVTKSNIWTYGRQQNSKMYVYKNSLNNLKKPSDFLCFTAHNSNGYNLTRTINYGWYLADDVKNEPITGNFDVGNKETKLNIRLQGEGNAKFTAIELGKTDILYKKLENELKKINKNYVIQNVVDISVIDGAYKGKVKLTFDVGTKNNGKTYIIGHLKSGLNYEEYTGKVENGKITINADCLSPFMISLLKEPTNIKNTTISKIADQNYTGKAIKPNPTIKNGKVALKNGTDYTVSYKNNTKLGTATVTIKGKGNYTGTVTKTFKIVIGKVAGVAAKTQATSSITLKWNKPSGTITGYEVYMATSKNGKYKKVATITKSKTTTYKKTKLSAGKTYYFKVKAYKTISGKKKYGSYSSVLTTTTKTKTPSISKVTAGKKKATVKWKKVTGATGYEVYMATSKNGKYTKIGTTTKNNKVSYTKTKLKSKKKYYFKVRTYRTVEGKKVYSSYSTVKSVKVK